jgi:predicted nucleic acid-binding protein
VLPTTGLLARSWIDSRWIVASPAMKVLVDSLQGSNTDFLLGAVAERHRLPILTTDHDFEQYARLLPVVLHQLRS